MNGNPPSKLFGRYHELTLLVIGFALTTLVGGYLAQSYQTRAAEKAREAAERTAELAAADG